MLAEALRMKHFDGIQYKSQLGDGMNVVVFDLSALAIGERSYGQHDVCATSLSLMVTK
jgi:hypothetical protein